MARIRKALVAAAGAAVPAGVAAFFKAAEDGTVDEADVATIVGAALAAGLAVGWATFRTPNELSVADLRRQANVPRAPETTFPQP